MAFSSKFDYSIMVIIVRRYLTITAYIGTAALVATAVFIRLASYAWYFDLFSNYIVQWCVVAVAWTILLIALRKIKIGLAVAALTAYIALPVLGTTDFFPVAYSHETESPSDGKTFSILQANVNRRNLDHDSLAREIARISPTVITLNEITQSWATAMTAELAERYPYAVVQPSEDHRGMAVFSSIPISRYEIYAFSYIDSPVIEVTLENGITLFAVHTLSPTSYTWAEGRNAFIKLLADRAAAVNGRVMVSGDLNITPYSPYYQPLMQDAHLVNASDGFGWQPTWMRGTPFAAAIDHILYAGNNIDVVNATMGTSIGSDHWPVIATFNLD